MQVNHNLAVLRAWNFIKVL